MVRKSLAVSILVSILLLSFTAPVLRAAGYDVESDNNVDADSNVDSVANKGTDGTTSYVTAQAKDGAYQNLTEAGCGPANAGWFIYRKNITVDASKITGSSNHANFPLLISVTDTDLQDHAQPDGDDIAFSTSTTWLDHEIELWNGTASAVLVAWVRIPSLDCSTNTSLFMYYGNSTMSSRENAAGVWMDYAGVWHMADDPSISDIIDSAGYNDGTMEGTMTSSDSVDCIVGKGLEFDGDDDAFDLGSIPSTNPLNLGGQDFTVTLWLRPLAGDQFQRIVDKSTGGSFANGWGIMMDDNKFHVASTSQWGAGTNPVVLGQWVYVQGVFNDATDRGDYWINGTFDRGAADITTSVSSVTANAHVGTWNHAAGREYTGGIDELRVANITRDLDWTSTEFNNQDDPDTFHYFSGEQTVNYRLEWEHEFQSVDTDKDSYNLSIYCFTSDSESYSVEIWNSGGSAWVDTGIDLDSQSALWENHSIDSYSDYIASSTTIRYVDNNQSSDAVESTLHVDYAGLLVMYNTGNNSASVYMSWEDSQELHAPNSDALLHVVIYDVDNTSDEIAVTLYYSNDSFGTVNLSYAMGYAYSPAANTYKFTYLFPAQPLEKAVNYYYKTADGFNVVCKPAETGVFFDMVWSGEGIAVTATDPQQFGVIAQEVGNAIFSVLPAVFIAVVSIVAFIIVFRKFIK